jgi:hypothetical protein
LPLLDMQRWKTRIQVWSFLKSTRTVIISHECNIENNIWVEHLTNATNNNENIIVLYHSHCVYVGEWLLFTANSAIFQLYHGENKLIFNEMMLRSAFY